MGFIVIHFVLLREVFEPVRVLLISFLFWTAQWKMWHTKSNHMSV